MHICPPMQFGRMPTHPAQPSPVKPGYQSPEKDRLSGTLAKLCPGKGEGYGMGRPH